MRQDVMLCCWATLSEVLLLTVPAV